MHFLHENARLSPTPMVGLRRSAALLGTSTPLHAFTPHSETLVRVCICACFCLCVRACIMLSVYVRGGVQPAAWSQTGQNGRCSSPRPAVQQQFPERAHSHALTKSLAGCRRSASRCSSISLSPGSDPLLSQSQLRCVRCVCTCCKHPKSNFWDFKYLLHVSLRIGFRPPT